MSQIETVSRVIGFVSVVLNYSLTEHRSPPPQTIKPLRVHVHFDLNKLKTVLLTRLRPPPLLAVAVAEAAAAVAALSKSFLHK